MDNPLYDPELDAPLPIGRPYARADRIAPETAADVTVPARRRSARWGARSSAVDQLLGTGLLVLTAWTLVMVVAFVSFSRPAAMQPSVFGATLLIGLLLAAQHLRGMSDRLRRFQKDRAPSRHSPGAEEAHRSDGDAKQDETFEGQPRIRITMSPSKDVRITIGPAKNPAVIVSVGIMLLAMLTCLIAWTALFAEGYREHRDDPGPPLIILYVIVALGWLVPIGFLVGRLLFELAAREVIVIGGKWLALTTRPFRFRKAETYALASIRNLRYEPLKALLLSQGGVGSRLRPGPRWYPLGILLWFLPRFAPTIALNCPGKGIHFGNDLTEDEARHLVATIKKHFKIPDEKPTTEGPTGRRWGLRAGRVGTVDSLRILAAFGLIGGTMPRALRVMVVFGLIGGLLSVLSCATAIDDALPSLHGNAGGLIMILGEGTAQGQIERADARFGRLAYQLHGGGRGSSSGGGGQGMIIAPMERVDVQGLGLLRGHVTGADVRGHGVALRGRTGLRCWLILEFVTFLKDSLLILACWKTARGESVGRPSLVVWSIFTLVSECLPLLWLTGGKEVDAWIQCVYPVAVLVLLRRPNVRSYFDRTPFEAHSGGPSLSK